MRRLIALLLLAGCASAGAPPGGPERKTPPAIVAITPDSGATNIKSKSVEIQFDEVVSDRAGQGELDKLFLISPRTSAPDAERTVRPETSRMLIGSSCGSDRRGRAGRRRGR